MSIVIYFHGMFTAAMDESLRRLQLMELQILKDIDAACNRHGLQYFLAYGTLIGAVRHQGFIPWDDDVDLLMPRADYIRFHEIVKKEMSGKYTIESILTNENYYAFAARLRLNGTDYPEEPLEDVPTHKGIFVDIMPLDEVKSNKGIMLNIRGQVCFYMSALRAIACGTKFSQNRYRTLARMMRFFARPFRGVLSRRIFELLAQSPSQTGGKYFVNFTSFGNWKPSLVSKEVYGLGARMRFEDGMFVSPVDYDTVLRRVYGDYMTPPPAEQQVAAHHTDDVDFGEYGGFLDECLKAEAHRT